jgi:hypothetical protein
MAADLPDLIWNRTTEAIIAAASGAIRQQRKDRQCANSEERVAR